MDNCRAAPRRARRRCPRYQLNYAMGLGHERYDADFGRWPANTATANRTTALLSRWAELMRPRTCGNDRRQGRLSWRQTPVSWSMPIAADQSRIFIDRRSMKRSSARSSRDAGCFCATKPDPGRGLPHHLYGRRPGAGGARQRGRSTRLPEYLPPSRQPAMPRRYGNAASFTCAYHGWTYKNDGLLTGVPYLKEAYHGELERERWGLVPVAQLDSYKGLLFATFDPEAPSLHEYLGEMAWYLDAFVDRREAGSRSSRPINGSCRATGNSRREFRRRCLSRAVEHLSAVTTAFSTGVTTKPNAPATWCRPATAYLDLRRANDVASRRCPSFWL